MIKNSNYYNAIIVDDETKLREVLKFKIEKFIGEIDIRGEASNIAEAKELITSLNPDIVFLDIAMPGGSGFELLESLDDFSFEIIFITGFHEYALDALKLSAVDYLLKPIKNEDLINAVEKAKSRLQKKTIAGDYKILKHNLNCIGNQSTKIGIPNNDAYDFVQVSDIIRCEGWEKYTKVYCVDNVSLISSYNVGVFKDMLDGYGFYSSHKSHLINKVHIKRYLKEGILVMSNGDEVPVARRRRDEFVKEVIAGKVIRN